MALSHMATAGGHPAKGFLLIYFCLYVYVCVYVGIRGGQKRGWDLLELAVTAVNQLICVLGTEL